VAEELVAVLVGGGTELLVVAVVVGVLAVVVVVTTGVLEEVEEVVVVVVVFDWQLDCAAERSEAAPCCRLRASAGLTPERLLTASLNAPASLPAALHWPAETSLESWSSCELSELAWSDESRPDPPPQAASPHAARPTAPPRSARVSERIRAVTLDKAICRPG
jgi:hypothetical protein